MIQPDILTIQDVWVARKMISNHVRKTPLFKSSQLSKQLDASVFLKLETMHEVGSFKIRGATNRILNLSAEEKKRGVITFSTGNHGMAVTYAAERLNIPAIVCLSNRVPEAKVNVLSSLGATVKQVGNSQDDAEAYCYKLADEEGLTVIKPFDDPHVIAGQGTIGLELLDDCPEINTVVIPVSGGGLFSGIALALKACNSKIRVIGVSMEHGAVMYHSLQAGHAVVLNEEATLADSLLGGIGEDNKYTFDMVKKYIDDFVLVSEEEIAAAMAYLFKNHRLVTEGAGATGIAALLAQKNLVLPGDNVAVIISGNNIGATPYIKAIQNYL